MGLFPFIKEKKICCSTKLSPIVVLSTRMCLYRLSSMYAFVRERCQLLFECEMMRLPWVDTWVSIASSLYICWQHTTHLLLPIVFVIYMFLNVSILGRFWSRSSPFPSPSPREQCVCLYICVCACARFLLFVDSVLSNSYWVKGSSTRTRCRFLFSSYFSIQFRVYPQLSFSKCFLSNLRTCFILSLKTKNLFDIHNLMFEWNKTHRHI
jgi:hypothetical protein